MGLILALTIFLSAEALAEPSAGAFDYHWDEGASDCSKASHPPLEVHPYKTNTFILRENLCSTFEAPFIYLLVGSSKALLIDTGDVTEANKMPLAKTVAGILDTAGKPNLPLLVVHTHRHLDHRSGDAQFQNMPNAQTVGFDLASVRRFYGFTNWPEGVGKLDLGARMVDVIPTPGHNETEVSFYDEATGLFFSGDFLMPARLLVDDSKLYLASAQRVAEFVRDRPVTFVLGGHIEEDARGQMYSWQSPFHPNEHRLALTKDDLLNLPSALEKFNGFYSSGNGFVILNPLRLLLLPACAAVAMVVLLVLGTVHHIRRRRERQNALISTEFSGRKFHRPDRD